MEQIYELADTLLNMCLESKDKRVTPNMLYNKTKASDKEINELKMILPEYGKFYGIGFCNYQWDYFQLYETKIEFVKNGGLKNLHEKEIKNEKWDKADKWIDRITKLIPFFK